MVSFMRSQDLIWILKAKCDELKAEVEFFVESNIQHKSKFKKSSEENEELKRIVKCFQLIECIIGAVILFICIVVALGFCVALKICCKC